MTLRTEQSRQGTDGAAGARTIARRQLFKGWCSETTVHPRFRSNVRQCAEASHWTASGSSLTAGGALLVETVSDAAREALLASRLTAGGALRVQTVSDASREALLESRLTARGALLASRFALPAVLKQLFRGLGTVDVTPHGAGADVREPEG